MVEYFIEADIAVKHVNVLLVALNCLDLFFLNFIDINLVKGKAENQRSKNKQGDNAVNNFFI